MTIRIILTTLHGHTDSQEIEVDMLGADELDFHARISREVKVTLDAWCLLPGDTIKIEEVE